MTLSVINRSIGVIAKLNAIAKIRKYKELHERHHFILMAMEVHDAPKRDMDCVIKECAHLFHDRQSIGYFILIFLHSIFQASCYYYF
jgi:hypothetical protein